MLNKNSRQNLDDAVPDDTTISYFRINYLGENYADEFFKEIVNQCIYIK
jgi:hypothetical protein